MKKILILTAGFGDGHNAAARNLREALELLAPDAQVTVHDPFEFTYGLLNTFMKRAYQGLVRYAPRVWSGVFAIFDNPALFGPQVDSLTRLRDGLRAELEQTQPDVVVSTYPVYGSILTQIFPDPDHRPFRLLTVVTDSISVCSAWYRTRSDLFIVANQPTAEVLLTAGVPTALVRPMGFPVSPAFADTTGSPLPPPGPAQVPRVLYVINTGKAKTGRALEGLLEIPRLHLTITVGRDASLKSKLSERFSRFGTRVQIYGWTNEMPRLLMSHHLLIGKAGGALVQETIAAKCPIIINQVIPGQEDGNAKLIEVLGTGMVARRNREVPALVEKALAHGYRGWQAWRDQLEKVSRPGAAIRIAELILAQPQPPPWPPPKSLSPQASLSILPSRPAAPTLHRSGSSRLLCDFHIHTNYSDGSLTLPEVVDFYGVRGFDCICVTDHVVDARRLKGKFRKLRNLCLSLDQLDEYFHLVGTERRRAWRKYSMLVLTGLEFNTLGSTRKTCGSLLGLDLSTPISPSLDVLELIAQIHGQGGLAVAARPHLEPGAWGKNSSFLWDNLPLFAPVLDAWEIANRCSEIEPAHVPALGVLANSDFHKPKHIYSWKTLLLCDKEPEAIKHAVRSRRSVSFGVYRDGFASPHFDPSAGRELLDAHEQLPTAGGSFADPLPTQSRHRRQLAS